MDNYDPELVKNRIQSPLEKRFYDDCKTVGLLVESQYPVGSIHADFAIPEKKIVIELDSRLWHSSEEAMENDEKRDLIYEKQGWQVIRIPGQIVYKHGELIAERIKNGDIAYTIDIMMLDVDEAAKS